MKAVIQRVRSASVSIEGKEISFINKGLLVLIGIEKDDSSEDLDYLVKKTAGLRIFKDENTNMNLSISDVGCELLVVSQFTLCADTSKGHRPSFINAAAPNLAENIYQQYCEKLREKNIPVKTGQFGSMMEVALINDGPVTILLDSQQRK
jgi:D-tyrosyl-tRNA(Tyr) deacylase